MKATQRDDMTYAPVPFDPKAQAAQLRKTSPVFADAWSQRWPPKAIRPR